jgi:hypothetical protein
MAEDKQSQDGLDGQFLVIFYRRLRLVGSLIVIAGMTFLFALFAWRAGNADVPTLDYSKIGVHLLLDDGRNQWSPDLWAAHIAQADAVASTGGIAVQLIRADDLDPQRWQMFLDLCAAHDLTPVLRLATTVDAEAGYWNAPVSDADDTYRTWGEQAATFINALDWQDMQPHVILLNEPNNGHEWSGRPDARDYAQFVVDVADVLRQRVPDVVLLNGALDLYAPNTGTAPLMDTDIHYVDADTFMTQMHSAQPDIFTRFDVWNSHAYPINLTEPPPVMSFGFDAVNSAEIDAPTPPDGIYNRGINGYEWALWRLQDFGVESLPVMITETGWRHSESVQADAQDASADYPDALTVVRYLDLAMRGEVSVYATMDVTWQAWLADERVIAVAPFALNGVPTEWGHTNWLQLADDGTIRDIYPMVNLIANTYPLD